MRRRLLALLGAVLLCAPVPAWATEYGQGFCAGVAGVGLTLQPRRDAYRAGLGLPALTSAQVRQEVAAAAQQNQLPRHCQALATQELRVKCVAAAGLDFWYSLPDPGAQNEYPLPDGSRVLCPSGEIQPGGGSGAPPPAAGPPPAAPAPKGPGKRGG